MCLLLGLDLTLQEWQNGDAKVNEDPRSKSCMPYENFKTIRGWKREEDILIQKIKIENFPVTWHPYRENRVLTVGN